MIEKSIGIIGEKNIEEAAIVWHKPKEAVYIIVSEDGSYKVLNANRMTFNTKYRGMDFYSNVINTNKAVKSKSILSNNIYSFSCKKNVGKEEIDEYYKKLELPTEKEWFKDFIIRNMSIFINEYKVLVKVFFPGTREEYREAGMKYFLEKCITVKPSINRKYGIPSDYGFPYGVNVNQKKPYSISLERTPYMVDREKGLQYYFFYKMLEGMYSNGYDSVVMWEKNVVPFKLSKGLPHYPISGGVAFGYKYNERGTLYIHWSKMIKHYNPFLGVKGM